MAARGNRRWLATVRFTHPAQQIVLRDYIDAIGDAKGRVEHLTEQIAQNPWRPQAGFV